MGGRDVRGLRGHLRGVNVDVRCIRSAFRNKVQNMITFLDFWFKVMTLRQKLIARLSDLIINILHLKDM
jgi:hypothetical protein